MNRLKAKDVAPFRAACLVSQGNLCALCKEPITETDRVVLDHNHGTGEVRGAIHNGCNVSLGKLENAARRYGVKISSFLLGAYEYQRSSLGVLHPTFRTPDEKKALAQKRRKRRAKCTSS